MTTAGLRLRGIHHRFGMTDVLQQVDLDLAAGETLALVGPSGCGKSTLLSIAAGLRTPSPTPSPASPSRLRYMFDGAV